MTNKPNLLLNLPPTFFTHPSLQDELKQLHALAGEVRQTSHNAEAEIADDLAWAGAVIMWSWPILTKGLLEPAKGLCYVGQINVARETALNCLEREIAVSDARHAWSPAVAELAFGLILNGLRRISDFHAEMRAGTEKWVEMPTFMDDIDPRERELAGAKVGLIGFGGIGRRLAKFMAPFEPEIRICDPYVSAESALQAGVKSVELTELLEESDIIVLCAANTPENDKMLGAKQIALLRPGALLINTARSMLLDTPALLARLRQGDVSYLVDVFDQEPLEADSEFRRLPNVYCTPHRAGGIIPSVQRSLAMLREDWGAVLEGTERQYAVAPEMVKASLA